MKSKVLNKTVKLLEFDLVKTKQNLGEALNAVYDFERKNQVLRRILEEKGKYNKLCQTPFSNILCV